MDFVDGMDEDIMLFGGTSGGNRRGICFNIETGPASESKGEEPGAGGAGETQQLDSPLKNKRV